MEIDFREPRGILRILALVAALCSSIIAGQTVAEGQQPPSIIGLSPLYGLSGATGWINSKPLTAKELKGKVVLVDFWTYSCINCLRSLPYLRAWADKYKDSGLGVIGVHTPDLTSKNSSPTCKRPFRSLELPIRSRSTASMRSGTPSTTRPGRLTTSS